jgi:hypothetical protein
MKTICILLVIGCLCVTSLSAQTTERSKLASQRKGDRNLHTFQSDDGTMTFTNRPEKYKHRGDYTEIEVKYERIPLPPQYKPTPRSQPKIVTDANLRNIVSQYSKIYGLDESLIYAVIRAESNFDPNAVSRAGARGLMQLMPGTAAEMGVTDIFDPTQNVAGGAQYLSKMMGLFNDKKLAVAAYNAGPENVKKHKGIPPFEETKNYVKTVFAYEKAYSGGAHRPNFTVLTAGNHPTVRPQQRQAAAESPFTVHFHSGLTQPADNVEDRDPYWYIEYGNRTYPVRKDLVKHIEEKA